MGLKWCPSPKPEAIFLSKIKKKPNSVLRGFTSYEIKKYACNCWGKNETNYMHACYDNILKIETFDVSKFCWIIHFSAKREFDYFGLDSPNQIWILTSHQFPMFSDDHLTLLEMECGDVVTLVLNFNVISYFK